MGLVLRFVLALVLGVALPQGQAWCRCLCCSCACGSCSAWRCRRRLTERLILLLLVVGKAFEETCGVL